MKDGQDGWNNPNYLNEVDVDTGTAAAERHSNWVNAYRQKVRLQISDISRRPAGARPPLKQRTPNQNIFIYLCSPRFSFSTLLCMDNH